MRLDRATIVLRPRSASEVMDLACRFGVVHAKLYLRLGALVLLPGAALCLALRYALDWPWWATWLAAAALAAIAQGAFTILASRLLFSEALPARAALAAFARRLPSYVGALLVSRALLAASSLALLLPLPFAWAAVLFQDEASLLEQAGPIASVRRSAQLVRGHGGLTALLLLLATQASCLVGAELFGQALVDGLLQLGEPFGSLYDEGGTPYAILGLFAASPLVATTRFLQYIDLRTRSDGWDVQVRFMAIAEREAAPRTEPGEQAAHATSRGQAA
ncbi:hypothetical protein SOCE26_044820 [Sorangium cellulosum]|uniref:Uncharacterized protein n=1 Tax=Sorangium cellulosum TaxID=56 RepID=A0A2L0EUT6_SORCE|nr:hypothetical protein [Sorangium cellulosum]AUX43042.1 hypothetical protein SOCE26_044820 [Sorangium cellulosum]